MGGGVYRVPSNGDIGREFFWCNLGMREYMGVYKASGTDAGESNKVEQKWV